MSITTAPSLPEVLSYGEHAASLLIRRADDELLWVKRGDSSPFLAGYWAFPGGMVNQLDLELAEGDVTRALAIAALREAREELGWGSALERHAELINALTHVGSWETHAYLPRRIEGHFFELRAESLERFGASVEGVMRALSAPADVMMPLPSTGDGSGELSDARWLSAERVHDLWSRGEVTLAPPTLALCRAALAERPLSEARAHSPELMRLNAVTPDVHLLPLRTPTIPPATHTNCYLIGARRFIIVDPGSPYPEEQARLLEEIDRRVKVGGHLEAVILTHHHLDHIGGVDDLLRQTGAKLAAHPLNEGLIPFEIDIKLEEGSWLVWGDDQPLSLVPPLTDTEREGVAPHLPASEQLQRWEVWHTPGHAPGHICLIDSRTRVGVVGDMVAGVGTIVIDPKDGGVGDYLNSLKRLRSRGLTKLLPSHGPPLAAPEALLTHYIKHRRAREEKVWGALPQYDSSRDRGEIRWRSLAEIVEGAYQDAPPMVRAGKHGGLAGRSALAHLIHLQEQGRALCCDSQPRPQSLWVALGDTPAQAQLSTASLRLEAMMSALRAQCPWDRRQTLESLKRYLIEESYEVLDTLERDASPAEHRDELGDLLFQVVFQAKIREEEGAFQLADVMETLTNKLSRRHPHVFGEQQDLSAEEVGVAWRRIKAEERAQRGAALEEESPPSALDGVPRAAPALLRAQLIGEKASAVGFDWPSVTGALAKVDEERLEVAEALASGDHDALTSELGDLFFAIVNVCRHLKISPEVALERTNHTFSARFRGVERLARERGLSLSELEIDDLEALWGEVKSQQR